MGDVFVVYAEYTGGCEDRAVVLAVCATEAKANEVAAAAARQHAGEYEQTVWARNPETGEVDPDAGDSDWDVDIRVEKHEVTG